MLPKVKEDMILQVTHFPTNFQAVIFRLWEMVPADRIAKTLDTDTETVCRLARDMGLGEQKWLDNWMSRGYISILRNVWNLLPYDQICTLLDWSEERLEYILREDDFLDIKLGGRLKFNCPSIKVRPLTCDEKEKTAKIRETIEKYILPLEQNGIEKPFDFFNDRYAPIASKKLLEVTPDNGWGIVFPEDNAELAGFVDNFKNDIKADYGIEFTGNKNGKINIRLDVKTDDIEFHEITITDNTIDVNAATPLGAMRALYYLQSLAEGTGAFSFNKKTYRRKTRIKTRFIYSFCSLYGDVLDKDSRISFPDKLLRGYAKQGINGVWIQGILYTLAPYPFKTGLDTGWEMRLANLKELCERAAKYGIKVYMYINEPRALPLECFDEQPHLKGASLKPGMACLCTSHPETQEYLKNALQTVCKHAPLLGGFLDITQSENAVHCYSMGIGETAPEHRHIKIVPCPVCSKRKASDVTAELLTVMADAISEVSDDIKLFVYAWAWKDHFLDQLEDLVEKVPKNAVIFQVSESKMPFVRGGISDEVRDYSLSIVGPGEAAKELWELSRKNGLEVGAKVQVNNSWECSTAPFLPVYEKVAEHIQNLSREGIEHIMLSWTLGGYMSDNIRIASAYFFEDEVSTDDPYDIVLKNSYGEYAETIKAAANHFCKGFSEYPFNTTHIYFGPSNAGASNLLYPKPTGLDSTMTCFPYDDLDGWCGVYTPEVLQSQYSKLCEEWEKGLSLLKDIPPCEFYDMAVYGYTLFKAALNQISYYILRKKGDTDKMRKIVKSEKELALMAYEILLRNSSIGYEAANHYYISRTTLREKIVQCDYLF